MLQLIAAHHSMERKEIYSELKLLESSITARSAQRVSLRWMKIQVNKNIPKKRHQPQRMISKPWRTGLMHTQLFLKWADAHTQSQKVWKMMLSKSSWTNLRKKIKLKSDSRQLTKT